MGLVDSILGQSQGDQYLQQLAEQRAQQRQQSASRASVLLDLAKLANNETSIANVEQLSDKMSGRGATSQLYKTAVKESVKGRRVAYDMFKEGINDANAMLSEQVFLPGKNEHHSISDILNNGELQTHLPPDAIIDIQKRNMEKLHLHVIC